MIDAAICKQFAVDAIQTRPEVEKTMQEHPVYNAPIPVVPNITLNISVNGVPVSSDSVSIESNVSDTDKSVNDTKIIESVSNADKDSDSKIILGDTENKTDNVEASDYSNIKVSKFKRNGKRSFSKRQANRLKKFIIDNHKDFNGDMTYYRIGKIFGISLTAVQKYAEEAKADFGKSDNGKNVKHTGKQSMLPKELYSEFLDFYVNHTMGETLEKYAKYGYTKASQIKDKLYSIRKELNTYKVKRRNGSVATVKKNK
jgi:predicted transcriptional regulator